jgi:golgin subfamily B member 1
MNLLFVCVVQLELQEATTARSDSEETTKLRRQVEEQRKQLEELRRSSDQRAKQIEERQKALEEAERQAKKRKEALDQLEERLKQQQKNSPAAAGAGPGAAGKQLAEKDSEIKQLKEDSQRAQSETERLLQLMQMTQEEQFAKDKTIMELQECVLKA